MFVTGALPDGKVFGSTSLGLALAEGTMNFPDSDELPGTDVKFPYFIIGDEAFPLRENLMRPYSRRSLSGEAQRIFNFRLSRARLTMENAFRVLSSRYASFEIIVLNKMLTFYRNLRGFSFIPPRFHAEFSSKNPIISVMNIISFYFFSASLKHKM